MAFVGQLGTPNGLSLLGLGGPPLPFPTVSAMPTQAKPFIAHEWSNDLGTFKGSYTLLNRPQLQMSLNGGMGSVTVQVSTAGGTLPALGDVVRLTEQDGDGTCLFTGVVEDVPDVVDPTATAHNVLLTPVDVELGDRHFTATYTTPTDVAQMVRDALALTSHLSWNWVTLPNTGTFLPGSGTDSVQFSQSAVSDVLHTALLMAGPTYGWHVDGAGQVWFQSMGSAADFSITQAQYSNRQSSSPITDLKNHIVTIGGIPTGDSAPITGLYDNPSSQAQYGLRVWDPPPSFPATADSTTLQNIATTLGGLFDHPKKTVQLTLPNYPGRITPGGVGLGSVRYWEPNYNPLPESEVGTGAYSPPYVVLGVTLDGIQQTVTLGDFPYTSQDDWSYLLDRILQRQLTLPLVSPGPTLSGHTVMQAGQSTGAGGGRLTVVDGSLHIRADYGNLPSYTDPGGFTSAAEYGIRAMDASGNLLFDSAGLVGVMQVLAFGSVSATIGSPGVTGTASFTLNRQSSILILTPHTVTPPPSAPSAVAETVHIYDNNTGLQGFSNCSFTGSNPGFTNGTLVDLTTLSAGSHSVELYAPTCFGGSFQFTGIIVVFLLGG